MVRCFSNVQQEIRKAHMSVEDSNLMHQEWKLFISLDLVVCVSNFEYALLGFFFFVSVLCIMNGMRVLKENCH